MRKRKEKGWDKEMTRKKRWILELSRMENMRSSSRNSKPYVPPLRYLASSLTVWRM
jgi:hypothetical protein